MENKNYNNVLIVYNSDFYKEIDLDDYEKTKVSIGNSNDCDIKLNIRVKDTCIYFNKINTSWQVVNGENTYCMVNDIKTPRKILINGDQISVKSLIEKEELFKINFFIDFVIEKENYDKVIPLNKVKSLTIGKDSSNNIIIDDEFVDGKHCSISIDPNNKYFITDLKSKYGVYVDGKKVEGKCYLRDNNFITICGYKMFYKNNSIATSNLNEKIRVKGMTVYNKDRSDSLMQFPCFYRSPRLLLSLPKEEIEIEKPPEKASKVSLQYLLTSIPLIGTVFLMGGMYSGMGVNSKYMIYSTGMILLSAMASIIMFITDFVGGKRYSKKRKKFYKEYIEKKEENIKEKMKLQKNNLKAMNPEEGECFEFVKGFNRRLWERKPEHDDFLSVMIGNGNVNLSFGIKIPKKENRMDMDKLDNIPYETKEKYKYIAQAPLCLNFLKENPIGLFGNREYSLKFIRDMIIKISTNYFFKDVKIVIFAPEDDKEQWKWARWIPHVWSDKRDIRFMAFNKKEASNVMNYLYDIAKKRDEAQNPSNDKKFDLPYFIVILADMKLAQNEPIMYYLENKNRVNITTVFMHERVEFLPKECTSLIEVKDNFEGKITNVSDAQIFSMFKFNDVIIKNCIEYSKKMAPIYVKSSFTESTLKSTITLFDLYKVNKTSEFNIFSNWQKNKVYKTMAVPIGVKAGDEIVYLNLHEKFHGPHGLVAGTTGSGKSELLQTFIASLAINFAPYDVSLIIIDYKGGGMANLFKNLPHLVGTITNLDGNQINRSLVSIKSELKRRQKIFGKYNVNHIDDYIKLYKEKKVKEPIPHLIIIADEFAELKNDQPEFMSELVSTARIGRSLGVHLILATQKPAGVVDNQIWSNSKFKLCLKVQNSEDSREVLKSPLAADIVEPGRGYFQVGNNEIFELFQSAWSGAKKYDEDDVNKKEIEIFDVGIDGTRKLLYSTKDKEKDKKRITQLDATIDEIRNVCIKHNVKRLKGPWLPPLSDEIYIEDLRKDISSGFDGSKWIKDKKWICPVVGILDDPERQSQRPIELDIGEQGHIFVIGAPGYGKTTFLQTLIMSLILQYTPSEVNIYILDFGTRTLKLFEHSAHVGGVVISDEEEKLMNLIKYLHKEINRRKKIFSSAGVASLKAYREIGQNLMPQIVVVLDNYAALAEFYPDLEDEFIFLSREGGTLGISLIITAGSYSSVRYKVIANFKLGIALTCVDKGEYSNITGRVRTEPENKKGRALIKLDSIYEFQIALPIHGENEANRAMNMKKVINEMNSAWNGEQAKKIPLVPKILSLADALKDLESNNGLGNSYKYSIGLDYKEIEYVYGDLSKNHLVTILGKSQRGKSNIIKNIAYMLSAASANGKVDSYLIDSQNYGLRQMKDLDVIKEYVFRTDETKDMILKIKDEIESRKNRINEARVNNLNGFDEKKFLENVPLIAIFIDDIDDFMLQFQDDKEVMELISQIVEKDKNLKVSLIIAGTEDDFNNYVYLKDFVKNLKKENYGFFLDNLAGQKFYEVNLPYNMKEKVFEKGDGYFINKDDFKMIKIPLYKK